MGTFPMQPSFAAGELSPSLYGRVDLAKYQSGCRTLLNFFVHLHGGISNRPGMLFVAEVKDSSKPVRLIPFEFSVTQTYVLEFGHLYMRVHKDGALVLDGDVPYELATPYAAADLPLLKITQSADTMYLAHPGYKPRKLTRTGHTAWAISAISWAPKIAAPTGMATNPSGTTNYYKVAAVSAGGEQSLPSTAIGGGATPVTVSWAAVTGAVEYVVYKAKNGVYGFIGTTPNTSFVDSNINADMSDTAQDANNPFAGNNHPGCVEFFQQRLYWGGSSTKPQTLWGSQSGNYENHNKSRPLKDDDAVEFSIAGRSVNAIRHMVPLKTLVVLTAGTEWVMSPGSKSDVVTPSSIEITPQSYFGSSHVPPILAGNSILFVQRQGNRVWEMRYTLEADGFDGNDLTVLAQHLFEGRTVKEWAYQQEPDSVIWCVMTDGTLCTLTYLRKHEVWAWARCETAGHVESVACIPGKAGDYEVWFVVRRIVEGQVRRYVERLASRIVGADAVDSVFLDSALTYDGRNTDSTHIFTLSANEEWGRDDMGTITATGHAPFTEASVGQVYHLCRPSLDDYSLYEAGGRVEITEYVANNSCAVRFLEDVPEQLRGIGTAAWARLAATFSGLGHLEGRVVGILGDGAAYPQMAVADGSVTTQSPVAVCHVGLPYRSEMETLDINVMTNEGTSQGRTKRVSRVTIRMHKTIGGLVGPCDDLLEEMIFRTDENWGDPIRLFSGDKAVSIDAPYDTSGRFKVVQDAPLPMTILAVIPEVEVYER